MQTITVTVEDSSPTLRPTDLAEFLFLFRAANVALSQVVPKASHDDLRQPSKTELDNYRGRLLAYSPKQIDLFFDPQTAPDLLRIDQIVRQSPMEIALVGCAFLVVLGVIISGGRIQINASGLKAVLPPFGKGLKCLREAFGLDKRLQASYGIRETTVKLSKTEFDELMTPVTGVGGFQSFFRGLQHRVNKQSRELTLSQEDLERIYRHKSDPQKGGWQARFGKIFGRHFPDDHSG